MIISTNIEIILYSLNSFHNFPCRNLVFSFCLGNKTHSWALGHFLTSKLHDITAEREQILCSKRCLLLLYRRSGGKDLSHKTISLRHFYTWRHSLLIDWVQFFVISLFYETKTILTEVQTTYITLFIFSFLCSISNSLVFNLIVWTNVI